MSGKTKIDWTDVVQGRTRVTWPIPNLTLGVSCSTQADVDERVPLLLATPAAKRVISLEPLLGPVVFEAFTNPAALTVIVGVESLPGGRLGRLSDRQIHLVASEWDGYATEADWLSWAEAIVAQCRAAGVSAWVKQIPRAGKLCRDISQFPKALRVREWAK